MAHRSRGFWMGVRRVTRGPVREIGLAAGVVGLLAALWLVYVSFLSVVDPVVPTIYPVPPTGRTVQPVLADSEGPIDWGVESDARADAPPVPSEASSREEREAWYDQVARDATDILQHCGEAGLDVACEGDICALRHAGAIGKVEYYREFARRPARLAYLGASWAGVLPLEDMPCRVAHDRVYQWFIGPLTKTNGQGQTAFCAARHRLGRGVPDGDRTAGRLCNRLAEARDGPDAAIFRE